MRLVGVRQGWREWIGLYLEIDGEAQGHAFFDFGDGFFCVAVEEVEVGEADAAEEGACH